VDRWFINHVHNDYIEIALETGLAGIILMVTFLLWWTGRTIAIWRSPAIDYYGRAATIATGALLAPSRVDFPLRTSGLAAGFAICLALMAGPRRRVDDEAQNPDEQPSRARHLSIG
jgi:O-antigen ligase